MVWIFQAIYYMVAQNKLKALLNNGSFRACQGLRGPLSPNEDYDG